MRYRFGSNFIDWVQSNLQANTAHNQNVANYNEAVINAANQVTKNELEAQKRREKTTKILLGSAATLLAIVVIVVVLKNS